MAASSSARKKSKQKKNQREGSTLTHLKKPFLYAAACILVFSLVSTPQFWTAVGTASIVVQGAIKSATHHLQFATSVRSNTTHTTEPTPTVSSKSPQSPTTGAQDNKIVPPATKSKASTETPINNPDQLPAVSATTTTTPPPQLLPLPHPTKPTTTSTSHHQLFLNQRLVLQCWQIQTEMTWRLLFSSSLTCSPLLKLTFHSLPTKR